MQRARRRPPNPQPACDAGRPRNCRRRRRRRLLPPKTPASAMRRGSPNCAPSRASRRVPDLNGNSAASGPARSSSVYAKVLAVKLLRARFTSPACGALAGEVAAHRKMRCGWGLSPHQQCESQRHPPPTPQAGEGAQSHCGYQLSRDDYLKKGHRAPSGSVRSSAAFIWSTDSRFPWR